MTQQEHDQPDESAGGVSGCEGVEEGNGGAREQPGQQQLAGQSGAPGFLLFIDWSFFIFYIACTSASMLYGAEANASASAG